MKKVVTRTAEYTVIEDNIFLCKLFDNMEISAADSQENYEAIVEIAGHKPYAVLVDARVQVTITKEGMQNSTKPEMSRNLIANAILVNSLANRIVGNFIIRFNKRSADKTRLFTSEEQALKWLKEKVRHADR